jgi:hypothetical protein
MLDDDKIALVLVRERTPHRHKPVLSIPLARRGSTPVYAGCETWQGKLARG